MKTTDLSRRRMLALGAAGVFWPGPGRPQDRDRTVEGGIGGTGIVGILTDFGSLIVAGRRVLTNDQTVYADIFGPLRRADLRLGDSLTVEAFQTSSGLVAARVHVTQPLIGPVERMRAPDVLEVNGVTVRCDMPVNPIPTGTRIAVSGLWDRNEVRASRLAPARGSADVVAGTVLPSGQIGGARVRGLGAAPAGSYAAATGRFVPDRGLAVDGAVRTRFTGAAGALTELVVEGYLAPISTAPGYHISGLGHSFARNLALDPFANERTLFAGAYTGLFAAQTAQILPSDPGRRRRTLRALAAQIAR